MTSSIAAVGEAGRSAEVSFWYQNAVDAMSSCNGRYRRPERQPKAWMVTRRSDWKRMESVVLSTVDVGYALVVGYQ